MRKLILGIVAVFVLVAVIAGVAVKVRSQTGITAIVYLNPDQAKALKQVDDTLASLKKQFDDLQIQRTALITGFALSAPKISPSGLEWGKKWNFEEAVNEWGFRELSAEEQQARAASQSPVR
jgi:hypothetical protein